MRFMYSFLKALGLATVCLAVFGSYSAWVIRRYKPALIPSPPFPKQVNGKPVVWIPDERARALVHGLNENDIEYIKLQRGEQWSGLPSSLVIRDKRLIRAFIKGMKLAVMRGENKYWKRSTVAFAGYLPHDTCEIITSPQAQGAYRLGRVHFFAADILEGETFVEGGAVSPEFQDALRLAGVPLPGAIQGFEKRVYDMWLENIGS